MQPTSIDLSTVAELEALWSILPSKTAASSSIRRNNASLSSRHAPSSPGLDLDFNALTSAYAVGNDESSPYPGVQALAARVRSVIEDGKLLVERTAKFARERDIYKRWVPSISRRTLYFGR